MERWHTFENHSLQTMNLVGVRRAAIDSETVMFPAGLKSIEYGLKHAFADFTPILDMPILGMKHAFADFTPELRRCFPISHEQRR